jgi:membrane protease YdiL (CAAX protease family)
VTDRFRVRLDWASLSVIVIAISLYTFIGLNSVHQQTAGYILGLALAGLTMMMVANGLKVEPNVSGKEQRESVKDFTLAFATILLSNGVIDVLPAGLLSVSGSPGVILGVMTGVAEETWFRGFLTPWLANQLKGLYGGSFYPGVFAQALLFMVYHSFVYASNINALTIVFLSGAVLGYIDLKAQRLFPSIAAHCLVNALAFGLI